MRAGFAGEDEPKCEFPTCVGVVKNNSSNKYYVGDGAWRQSQNYDLIHPLQHGIIEKWEEMETIWAHTFEKELKVESKEHSVILSETPLNPAKKREKTMEIMFERFGVTGYYVSKEPVMAVISSGRYTATVADVGSDVSFVAPVYEGACLSNNVCRMEMGGSDLTDYMLHLLQRKGYSFGSDEQTKILMRDIKEKCCYVALDYENEISCFEEPEKHSTNYTKTKEYELPDMQKITLGRERADCPEALFQPSLIGKDNLKGIHEAINDTILNCDESIQRDMFCNTILSGGGTLMLGTADRLQREIHKKKNEHGTHVMIVAPPERKFSTWIGGSVLGCISSFDDTKITKFDYEEHGARIVHRRCF
uniref:Actin n=1 Tax=Paramoeba aestuarina TaxID=180227 RepID=A0A7S4KIP6_9EUKA